MSFSMLNHIPSHLSWVEAFPGHKCLALYDGEFTNYAHILFKVQKGGEASFHLKFCPGMSWYPSAMKEAVRDWPAVKQLIKDQGAKSIVIRYKWSSMQDSNVWDGMYELLCRFGFSEPKLLAISGMRL